MTKIEITLPSGASVVFGVAIYAYPTKDAAGAALDLVKEATRRGAPFAPANLSALRLAEAPITPDTKWCLALIAALGDDQEARIDGIGAKLAAAGGRPEDPDEELATRLALRHVLTTVENLGAGRRESHTRFGDAGAILDALGQTYHLPRNQG